MNTLVEQALKVKHRKYNDSYTEEQLDLVIAYLNGDITNRQMTTVHKLSPSAGWVFASRVLLWAVRNKKLIKSRTTVMDAIEHLPYDALIN